MREKHRCHFPISRHSLLQCIEHFRDATGTRDIETITLGAIFYRLRRSLFFSFSLSSASSLPLSLPAHVRNCIRKQACLAEKMEDSVVATVPVSDEEEEEHTLMRSDASVIAC